AKKLYFKYLRLSTPEIMPTPLDFREAVWLILHDATALAACSILNAEKQLIITGTLIAFGRYV
ncbi:MAG: hypothetical protein KGJ96_13350, partial [Xanthomonadaceae bacterium]|nr:hypothetical protein [Xanthomonadaceae bacterium]